MLIFLFGSEPQPKLPSLTDHYLRDPNFIPNLCAEFPDQVSTDLHTSWLRLGKLAAGFGDQALAKFHLDSRKLVDAIFAGEIGDTELKCIQLLSKFDPLPGESEVRSRLNLYGNFLDHQRGMTAEIKKLYLQILDNLLSSENPKDHLRGILFDHFIENNFQDIAAQPEVFRATFSAIAFHVEKDDSRTVVWLQSIASQLLDMNPSTQALINYSNAYMRGDLKNVNQSMHMFGEIGAHTAIRETILNTDFRALVLYRTATNGVPLGIWQARVRTDAAQKFLQNFDQLYDGHGGFIADTFTARRPVRGERAVYEKFARDIAERVGILFQKDKDGFPGPGYVLENVNLKNALSAHRDDSHSDPLHVYKTIWPEVAGVLEDLAQTRIVHSRAFLAITGPNTEKFGITLESEPKKIHYSLVIFNANHGDTYNDIACLVPTEILDEQLGSSVVQVSPSFDQPDPMLDVNQAKLRPEQLIAAAEARGLKVFQVGSGIVAAGDYEDSGRVNINAEPLSQKDLDEGFIRSIYGLKTLTLSNEMRVHAEKRPDLAVSELHKEISDHVASNLSLWQAVKLIRANWSKGNTGGQHNLKVQFNQEMLEAALRDETLPEWWNGNSLRMLQEAYTWNSRHDPTKNVQNANDEMSYPVLVIADSRRHAEKPKVNSILIDTFAGVNNEPGMTFRDIKGNISTIKSPSGGASLEDAVFFIREVLQHCTSDSLEVRLCDRRMVDWKRPVANQEV